jgi:histidine triad (HIT) family protein
MSCVFCAIRDSEEPAVVVDETDETLAFAPLDAVSEGHLLVIPKAHHETLFDVPESTFGAVMAHAKRIAEELRAHRFDGVNLLHASGRAAGQSVQHFHLHLAPRRDDDGLDCWPETEYEEQDREETYGRVRDALDVEGAH